MIKTKYLDKCLILAFLIIIFVPAFGLFVDKDPNEIRAMFNREPFPVPHLSIKAIGRTDFKGIEYWYGDKALFITLLSKIWSNFNYNLGVSTKFSQVIIGKNGWLFLGNFYGATLDQYAGKALPNKEQLILFTNAFKDVNELAKKNNIPFLMVVAPDKHNVYPEYLPKYIQAGAVKTVDIIEKRMKQNNIDFINLKHAELAAKKTMEEQYGALYLKGDSHWNFLGAYVGYNAIAEYLAKKGIVVDNAPVKFLSNITKVTDLAGFLLLSNHVSYAPTPEVSSLALNLEGQDINNPPQPLHQLAAAPASILSVPYEITNNAVNNNQSCLLIGDSFLVSLEVFFLRDFHKIIVVHNLNKNVNLSDLINKYHPNAIVFEIVERNLLNYANNFQATAEKIDLKVAENIPAAMGDLKVKMNADR